MGTIPTKLGMLIIYTPALCTAAFTYLSQYGHSRSLANIFSIIHFLKRDLEVMFLHKYSGTMDLPTAIMIGTWDSLVAFLVLSVASPERTRTVSIIGSVLFTIGMLGNLYHHYLLSCLRGKTHTNKHYVAPRGGLFEFVATPHYLFELVTWLGIAVVSQHLNVYLVFTSMSSYLSGRSVAQNKWNRDHFKDAEWPITRKNILPFIF